MRVHFLLLKYVELSGEKVSGNTTPSKPVNWPVLKLTLCVTGVVKCLSSFRRVRQRLRLLVQQLTDFVHDMLSSPFVVLLRVRGCGLTRLSISNDGSTELAEAYTHRLRKRGPVRGGVSEALPARALPCLAL